MANQIRKRLAKDLALHGRSLICHPQFFVALLGLILLGVALGRSQPVSAPPSLGHRSGGEDCSACHAQEKDDANDPLDEGEDLSEIEPLAVGTGRVYGYASASSIPQGGSLDLYVSTAIPAYDIQISREGPSGRELMMTLTDMPGAYYECGPVGVPAGQEDVDLGCDWPVAYTLDVPADWPSGIYVADLLDEDDSPGDFGSYIFFIVTEDQPGSTASIVFQSSTNTWQAYNSYEDWSLYTDPPARRITFDRPYKRCTGCRYAWEVPLLRWLESEGYAVEYVANEDVHVDPTLLYNYTLFLSVGHDEYWSKEIRDNIDAFIDAGGNVAVFSGNTGYRQVRYEDGGQTLICYKSDRRLDPLYGVDSIRVATEFAVDPVFWPENSTTGVGFRNGGWVNPSLGSEMAGRYTAYRSGHWVYAGTGLHDGDEFWYEPVEHLEVDGALFTWENGLPVVTGEDETPLDFLILGLQPSTYGYATMGIYSRDGGGTVFNAATMGWGRGLWPETNPEDYEIVRQITRNVIDTLSSGDPPPPPTYAIQETSFSYQPPMPLVDEPVSFSAAITPWYATPPITYTWEFGDGAPAVSTNDTAISHTYDAADTYTVSVTAASPYGQSVYSQTMTVIPTYGVEQVSFAHQPTSPPEDRPVTFTAAITPSYSTPPITYAWSFGDDAPVVSTGDNTISHTYDAGGTYMVSVTAANLHGQNVYSQTISVVPTYAVEETAFVYQPIVPPVDEPVAFTATITPSHASLPITYTWTFGDGAPAVTTSGNTISHTFGTIDTYAVSVTAVNPYGQSIYSQTISVVPEAYMVYMPLVIKR